MTDLLNGTITLITLTILEVVLGIDNLIFLAIISQRLPKHLRKRARQIGLTLAWVSRLILLASAILLTKLTTPLFSLFGYQFTGRDIFLIAGGLFLLAKSTQEIHTEIEPAAKDELAMPKYATFISVVIQIVLLDVIFSLDSVLTAIGLTQNFWLMTTSITIAIILMIFASEPLTHFVEKNPTIKMLALTFLMLIGMILISEGFEFHIPRGYVYFAMGFSLFVESLNIIKRKTKNVSR